MRWKRAACRRFEISKKAESHIHQGNDQLFQTSRINRRLFGPLTCLPDAIPAPTNILRSSASRVRARASSYFTAAGVASHLIAEIACVRTITTMRNIMIWCGELANTISGNARRDFGNFQRSCPSSRARLGEVHDAAMRYRS